MKPENLLKRLKKKDFAFLLGNGINRYVLGNDVDCSWKGLLKQTATHFDVIHELPSLDTLESVSYPEYYSMLLLKALENADEMKKADEKDIQNYIKDIIEKWPRKKEYDSIKKSLFEKYDCPVLTTNVDALLDEEEYRLDSGSSNHLVFPADVHYSKKDKENHINGCSIWHINGTIKHIKSVRFGAIDYSKLIYRVYSGLEEGKAEAKANSEKTWIQIIMDLPLCIVGLNLEQDEFFLRSLLLRKVRYNKGLSPYGWYCYTSKDTLGDDKRDILKCMGIEPVMFEDYDAMYKGLFGIQKAKPETTEEKPLHFSDD